MNAATTNIRATINALDLECGWLYREFCATENAMNEGLPPVVLRVSFAEIAQIANRIASIANAQVGQMVETTTEAAE